MAKISLHDLDHKKEISSEEADSIIGGSNNYGMAANTGSKTGGNATNNGDIAGGAGGGGGSATGNTYGNNTAGFGGSANQWTPFGSIAGSNVTGGAGGSVTNIGAKAGDGGAGGNAVGAEGGAVTDNIITEINIPVTMNI